jgi:hypothetical protein
LVEVLFATAVAAFLIVVTLTLMNRNLAQIQMSVETTFVREAIDSQAEVLRYMRDQYMEDRSAEFTDPPANTKPTISKLWKDMVDTTRNKYAQTSATEFGTCQPDDSGNVNGEANGKAFFINTNLSGEAESDVADIKTLDAAHADNLLQKIDGTSASQTYARPGHGIWIEAVNPSFTAAQTNRYVDFHIRACWDPPYINTKASLGTIVRLYYETPGGSLGIAYTPRCSDGVDNDGDALIDGADPGCVGPSDNDETNAPPFVPPSPTNWGRLGADYSICEDATSPNMCQVESSQVYSFSGGTSGYPPFKVTYPTTVGGLGLAGGDYKLQIEYANKNESGLPPPPLYSYNIDVYINGILVKDNLSLPSAATGVQTFNTTISGLTGPVNDISLVWDNDFYNATSDANFKIYTLSLDKL